MIPRFAGAPKQLQRRATKEKDLPRILHLIASGPLAGPEMQLLHHAHDTRGSNYEVILGSFQDHAKPPEILTFASQLGIETVSVPGGARPGLVDDVSQYLRNGQIDLLCTHGYKATIVGHFAAKHANVPWVPFLQGPVSDTWQGALYERLERSLLVRSPWVVCVSPVQARQLGRMRRGRRSPLVIQNAVLSPEDIVLSQWPAPSRKELGFSGRTFVFGAVGSLGRKMGHRFLLDAFATLHKMLPGQPMELLLLGEGHEETALRTQAQRLGIGSQVCFAGFQRGSVAWMKVMDCLVQPSLTEGTLNSILEAMSLGVPVIATAVGGVPDVVHNGQTGLLVGPGAPVALAEAMKKMVRSEALRSQLASEAKYRVEEDFSPKRQRTLLEMLYKMMLGDVFPVEDEGPAHGVA